MNRLTLSHLVGRWQVSNFAQQVGALWKLLGAQWTKKPSNQQTHTINTNTMIRRRRENVTGDWLPHQVPLVQLQIWIR
jgi:hypothetical protein